jgi:hypothetical protein
MDEFAYTHPVRAWVAFLSARLLVSITLTELSQNLDDVSKTPVIDWFSILKDLKKWTDFLVVSSE